MNTRQKIQEIKSRNENAGGHFFDRKTLKFFRQKVRDFSVAEVDGQTYVYASAFGKFIGATIHKITVGRVEADGRITGIADKAEQERITGIRVEVR